MCSGEMEGVCVVVRWRGVCVVVRWRGVCSGEMEGVCRDVHVSI